jgi:putative transposase
MARAYWGDLRARVIDRVAQGGSARGAARRFGIGVTRAARWARVWRESGACTARKPRGSKLDPYPYS